MIKQEINKRLQVIKNLLLLEDYETLALQVEKVKAIANDDKDLKEMMSLLDAKKYSGAIKVIEGYINKNSGIDIYRDPEIDALKIELKALEIAVADNFVLQQELENTISQF